MQGRCVRLTFYDDDPETGYAKPPKDLSGPFLVGINDPTLRRQMVERYRDVSPALSLIDPSALVGSDVVVGLGSVIAPNASILHSVTLGNHVHVNYHSSMIRCQIGSYSTISPAATICGNVMIGEVCLIGANSTVCERVTIGNNVTVGAGAIIPPYSNVPDGVTVTGVWHG